jgi:hypothetical protein
MRLTVDFYDGTKMFYFAFESYIDKIIQEEGLEWVLPAEIPDPSCPAAILRKERLHQALTMNINYFKVFMSYKRNLSVIAGKVQCRRS